MNIDLSKYKKMFWFEDIEGNIYDNIAENLPKDIDMFTYHRIETNIYKDSYILYTYHPEHIHMDNHFYQAMLQFPWFYKFMFRRMKKKGMSKTFKNSFGRTVQYGDRGAECIAKMAESGDFTYSEAQYVYATSCERCMNVLLHKYVGNDGYEEFSNEWKKCPTICDWCKDIIIEKE